MLAPAPQRETSDAKITLVGWSVRHAAFFLVFAVSLWYAAENLNRGWIRHDDGALGQMAERVLHGELPHRDFNEIYTGALDYPHALAFMLFGTTLTSLRLVLFGAFVLWLPAVYRIALFSGPPWAAALITLMAAVWSIPNYSASMPSWYNLFLATGAALCVLQCANDPGRRMRWLFFAGLCCGISIIVKITGMYALAAALLACVYLEAPEGQQQQKTKGRAYAVFVGLCLFVFVVAVLRVLGERTNLNEMFAFLLPCALVSYLAARRVALAGSQGGLAPFLRLGKTVTPLLLGTAVPSLLFIAPYVWTHSLGALYRGTLVAPFRRVNVTVYDSTDILQTWPAMVLIALLLVGANVRLRKSMQLLIAATALCFLVITADSVIVLQPLWHAAFDVVPYLAMAITIWMIMGKTEGLQKERIFVLLAFAACCNLTRFPFSHPAYFFYVAPLVLLAIFTWLEQMPKRSPAVLLAVLAFFLAFDVMRIKPPFLNEMATMYLPDENVTAFRTERARGIRSTPEIVDDFEGITSLVRQHSRSNTIYAGPDAPEIYFLSEKQNPTRDIFDFLNENAVADANKALDRGDIDVVVWCRFPQFSHGGTHELLQRIERDYPNVQHMWGFDVRWR